MREIEMCMTTLVFNEYVYEYKGNTCLILLTWELGTPEVLGFMLGEGIGSKVGLAVTSLLLLLDLVELLEDFDFLDDFDPYAS